MGTRARVKEASDVAFIVAVAAGVVHDLLRLRAQPDLPGDWVDSAVIVIVAVTMWVNVFAKERVVPPRRLRRRFWIAMVAGLVLVFAFAWAVKLPRRDSQLLLDASWTFMAAGMVAEFVKGRRAGGQVQDLARPTGSRRGPESDRSRPGRAPARRTGWHR